MFTSMSLYVFCIFFFFQAEDGIRDLVRSRGLGDVYKRQAQRVIGLLAHVLATRTTRTMRRVNDHIIWQRHDPVSYTHLTLPTSDLV